MRLILTLAALACFSSSFADEVQSQKLEDVYCSSDSVSATLFLGSENYIYRSSIVGARKIIEPYHGETGMIVDDEFFKIVIEGNKARVTEKGSGLTFILTCNITN